MRNLEPVARVGARILWHAFRMPVLLFLVVLEPVVVYVFWALALLGILMSLFYKAIGIPHFPFWTMLAISLGFAAVIVVYQGLIRILKT